MSIATKIRDKVMDTAFRARTYEYTRKVLKLRSNQCAATVSMLLIEIGVLDRVRTWTTDLAAALEAKGWTKHTGTPPPHSICFSEDKNDNNAPDHVFTAVEIDKTNNRALVYDNYSVSLTWRNLGRGPKTPLAYYMLPPKQAAAKPFNELEAGNIRDAFRVLYAAKDKLPAAHGQLNALRETFRLAGVAHANENIS